MKKAGMWRKKNTGSLRIALFLLLIFLLAYFFIGAYLLSARPTPLVKTVFAPLLLLGCTTPTALAYEDPCKQTACPPRCEGKSFFVGGKCIEGSCKYLLEIPEAPICMNESNKGLPGQAFNTSAK
ncbi:hypothetical protein HZC09_04000 [Candidatus Micrarchaeota archaeon]|nr:hypothetical protein [Candidatus Micrarchaeota archaeon]MBI5228500.1 hypothetical protein [Candidatus Micrarchaeota archaeon]